VDAVLVRTDPPFDSDYLATTLLLEHLRGDTLVVNDPRGLREANEKLYACRFPDLMPPTPRVSSPASGRSILMTSAPRSPSSCPAHGPARTRLRSSTRRWESGREAACSLLSVI
jgi:hypothetical protein